MSWRRVGGEAAGCIEQALPVCRWRHADPQLASSADESDFHFIGIASRNAVSPALKFVIMADMFVLESTAGRRDRIGRVHGITRTAATQIARNTGNQATVKRRRFVM
jgi:hypothetical protein